MSAYRLHDAGYPTFKKILHGRKWVGRVCKVQDGYLGIINAAGGSKVEFKAPTEAEAFDEVCARQMGYDSAAALRARNSQVRQHNNAVRRDVQGRAADFLQAFRGGTLDDQFAAMDRLLGIPTKD